MTRSSSYHLLACPRCRKTYKSYGFAAFAGLPKQFWSDGRIDGTSSGNSRKLLSCTCGHYFLSDQAISMGQIPIEPMHFPMHPPRDEVAIPAFLLRDPDASPGPQGFVVHRPSILQRLFNWLIPFKFQGSLRVTAFNSSDLSASPAKIPFQEAIPTLRTVSGDDVVRILHAPHEYMPEIVKEARKLHWANLNDGYRHEWKLIQEGRVNHSIGYAPTREQVTNMRTLIVLLQEEAHPDNRLLGELHRQLGEFNTALAYFEKARIKTFELAVIDRLSTLAGQHQAEPILL